MLAMSQNNENDMMQSRCIYATCNILMKHHFGCFIKQKNQDHEKGIRFEQNVRLPKASDHQFLLLSSHAHAEQWSDLTQSCQQIDGVLNWYRINGVGLW